jgi:hypothetical protein
MTRQAAIDFFADLLPAEPKKETLFDTPVKKVKRMPRRWKVTSVAVLTQLSVCQCCGTHFSVTNPHMMLTKELNDYDGRILKTVQTDCPDEADLLLITDETPVSYSHIAVSKSTICSACVNEATPNALRLAFMSQVKRLQDDPERRKAQAEKADKAEQELMDLISSYENHSQTTISVSDDDLPY